MRFVRVSLTQLLSMMAALGNDVQGILVGNDMVCYIMLPDERTSQTQQVLQQYGAVTMELSTNNCGKLMGNTPMNLRSAIQTGALQPPSDAHRHLWEQVCAKAGIVEVSYAQTAVKALQYALALALFGHTSNA